mgnify:FL=1
MVTRCQARILTFVRQCGFSISKTNKFLEKNDVYVVFFDACAKSIDHTKKGGYSSNSFKALEFKIREEEL